MDHADPGHKESGGRSRGKDGSGAEVRLEEYKTSGQEEDHGEWDNSKLEIVEVVTHLGEPAGEIDHERHLGDLAGLKGDRAEPEPAGRTVSDLAQAWNQHQRQETETQQIDGNREARQ